MHHFAESHHDSSTTYQSQYSSPNQDIEVDLPGTRGARTHLPSRPVVPLSDRSQQVQLPIPGSPVSSNTGTVIREVPPQRSTHNAPLEPTSGIQNPSAASALHVSVTYSFTWMRRRMISGTLNLNGPGKTLLTSLKRAFHRLKGREMNRSLINLEIMPQNAPEPTTLIISLEEDQFENDWRNAVTHMQNNRSDNSPEFKIIVDWDDYHEDEDPG
jgi:hypothetical protein